MCVYTHMHKRTRTHIHKHVHIHTHAHTHVHVHTHALAGRREERHLLADQSTLKVAFGGKKPVAPPDPTGVEKIKVEMQAFLDQTSAAATVLAGKTATGAAAGGAFVKDKAVLVGTYLTETSKAAGDYAKEKVAAAGGYTTEKVAAAAGYLGEQSIKAALATNSLESKPWVPVGKAVGSVRGKVAQSLGFSEREVDAGVAIAAASSALGAVAATKLGDKPINKGQKKKWKDIIEQGRGMPRTPTGPAPVAVGVETTAKKSPVPAEKSLAPAEKSPALVEQIRMLEEKSPALAEKSPVMAEKTPVLAEKSPVMAEKSPVLAEKSPVLASLPDNLRAQVRHSFKDHVIIMSMIKLVFILLILLLFLLLLCYYYYRYYYFTTKKRIRTALTLMLLLLYHR
jgi:hypothetical protein